MPLDNGMISYEYECKTCGRRIERAYRTIADREDTVPCPCGGTAERVFSAPQLLSRGPGFYCTDYRKGSPDDAG